MRKVRDVKPRDEPHAVVYLPQENMTLQEAKSIACHLGLTLRQVRSRELPRWKRDHGLLHGQSNNGKTPYG
jgi:hypothetical protein